MGLQRDGYEWDGLMNELPRGKKMILLNLDKHLFIFNFMFEFQPETTVFADVAKPAQELFKEG